MRPPRPADGDDETLVKVGLPQLHAHDGRDRLSKRPRLFAPAKEGRPWAHEGVQLLLAEVHDVGDLLPVDVQQPHAPGCHPAGVLEHGRAVHPRAALDLEADRRNLVLELLLQIQRQIEEVAQNWTTEKRSSGPFAATR